MDFKEASVSAVCCCRQASSDCRREVSSCSREVIACRLRWSFEYVLNSVLNLRDSPLMVMNAHNVVIQMSWEGNHYRQEKVRRRLGCPKLCSKIGILQVIEEHLRSRVEVVLCLDDSFFLEFCFGWVDKTTFE